MAGCVLDSPQLSSTNAVWLWSSLPQFPTCGTESSLSCRLAIYSRWIGQPESRFGLFPIGCDSSMGFFSYFFSLRELMKSGGGLRPSRVWKLPLTAFYTFSH